MNVTCLTGAHTERDRTVVLIERKSSDEKISLLKIDLFSFLAHSLPTVLQISFHSRYFNKLLKARSIIEIKWHLSIGWHYKLVHAAIMIIYELQPSPNKSSLVVRTGLGMFNYKH